MIIKNTISFRDDSARVVKIEQKFCRYIFFNYKNEYDHLMISGLYDELVTKELLIDHKEIDFDPYDNEIYKLILPFQIPFQSYPFEWSYIHWKKAILAYLKINLIALKYGMILKDATPYNFFQKGGKAILFDTTSFIFFKKNDSWIAYRQFCQEFLAPIALIYFRSPEWSRLTMSHLRGMDLRFVSKHLPFKSYFNLTIFLNIHLQSKFTNNNFKKKNINKGFVVENLIFLHNIIYKSISNWKNQTFYFSEWYDYYEKNIESQNYINKKVSFLKEVLVEYKPISVLDLGANSGIFSFISSEYSKKVIAVESDYGCIDLMEKRIEDSGNHNIFTLYAKITEFSNGLGLQGKEIQKLSERIVSDLVLVLALVHHLYINCFLSFAQIVDELFNLSNRFVLIEFVPQEDPKVIWLMQSKNRKLIDYNEIEFETAFRLKFKLLKKEIIHDSLRIIYFFEKI